MCSKAVRNGQQCPCAGSMCDKRSQCCPSVRITKSVASVCNRSAHFRGRVGVACLHTTTPRTMLTTGKKGPQAGPAHKLSLLCTQVAGCHARAVPPPLATAPFSAPNSATTPPPAPPAVPHTPLPLCNYPPYSLAVGEARRREDGRRGARGVEHDGPARGTRSGGVVVDVALVALPVVGAVAPVGEAVRQGAGQVKV